MANTWEIIQNLYNTFENNPDNIRTKNTAKAFLGAAPVVGLPVAAWDTGSGLYEGDYTKAGLGLLGVAGQIAGAKPLSGLLGDVAEGITPWTITQEYVPGIKGHLEKLPKAAKAVKDTYSANIAKSVPELPGETGRTWGSGYWDGDSNPTQMIDMVAPDSQVQAAMAGLGRATSQAAEAANKRIPLGGLLGREVNAVEIALGRPATPEEIATIAKNLPDGVVYATAKNGARVFNGWTDNATTLDAGKNAAKLVGGKAKNFAGKTMYFERPEYQAYASNNPGLANQVAGSVAPESMINDLRVSRQLGLPLSTTELLQKFRGF